MASPTLTQDLPAGAAGTLQTVITHPASPAAEVRAQLVAFVNRRVENLDVAEDIVQDVLERFHRTDPGTVTNSQAWLYRSARNAIIDHYRKRRDVVPLLGSDDYAADNTGELGSNEPAAVIQELARCLRPLVDQLPTDYRDALTLVDLDGRTHTAAAESAGISTSGMKSRVQRGRKQLANLLHQCCVIETTAGTIDDYRPRNDSCMC